MVRYALLVLFVLHVNVAHCCINEYKVLLNGSLVETEDAGGRGVPVPRFDSNEKEVLAEMLRQSDSLYKVTGKVEDYSDYGAMLVYNARYAEAKRVFLEIENRAPGLYQTAANLGTVYELLGQNDSALIWIRKAVAINPDSHKGSEWIHVKILEAKLKANSGKQIITPNILALDFGDSETPENKRGIDLALLLDHLSHQLSERMFFVKPKDPVVAQLLFDLGNVSAMTGDIKSGIEIFKVAREYGYASELLDKRQERFESLQMRADMATSAYNWFSDNPRVALAMIAVGMVCLLVVITLVYRKFRRRKMS